MRRIFTFGHRPAERNWTVSDLRANKGKVQLTEVTAMNAGHAARAAAGIDTLMTWTQMLKEVRETAPNTFINACPCSWIIRPRRCSRRRDEGDGWRS